MTRPIALVRTDFAKKLSEIKRLQSRIDKEEKPPMKLLHQLNASKSELDVLKREMFGDWLPPSMIKEEDSDG
jgi:hypothetical protein